MDHPLIRDIQAVQRGLWHTATFPASAPTLQQAGAWWAYRSRLTQELTRLQEARTADTAPHGHAFGTVRQRPGA
jgi:hypothetical protein